MGNRHGLDAHIVRIFVEDRQRSSEDCSSLKYPWFVVKSENHFWPHDLTSAWWLIRVSDNGSWIDGREAYWVEETPGT
jgi:hypothetical protein